MVPTARSSSRHGAESSKIKKQTGLGGVATRAPLAGKQEHEKARARSRGCLAHGPSPFGCPRRTWPGHRQLRMPAASVVPGIPRAVPLRRWLAHARATHLVPLQQPPCSAAQPASRRAQPCLSHRRACVPFRRVPRVMNGPGGPARRNIIRGRRRQRDRSSLGASPPAAGSSRRRPRTRPH